MQNKASMNSTAKNRKGEEIYGFSILHATTVKVMRLLSYSIAAYLSCAIVHGEDVFKSAQDLKQAWSQHHLSFKTHQADSIVASSKHNDMPSWPAHRQ